MDSYGRIFYIDHKNHTTTWVKPVLQETVGINSQASNLNSSNNHQQERQQLDRRYQCIRKSIAKNASIFLQDASLGQEADIAPQSTVSVNRQREFLINVGLLACIFLLQHV